MSFPLKICKLRSTPLVNVDWKPFQIMSYIIVMKVRKFWHSKEKIYTGGGRHNQPEYG